MNSIQPPARWPARAVALVLLAAMTIHAKAQVSRGDGGGDAVARVQAMLQQERARVAELTATNRRLTDEAKKNEARIVALESQVKAAKRSEAALESRLSRSENSEQTRSAELANQRDRFDMLLTKSREIAGSLRDTEQRANQLSRDLAERDGQLGDCTAKNAELLSINEEMVAYLRGEGGVIDGLLLREPFTGLKRVRRENMADDFDFRARDNAVVDASSDGEM